MLMPVGRRNFVLDEEVHCRGIRHPKDGLGKAHKRDTFLRRKTVFNKQSISEFGRAIGPKRFYEVQRAVARMGPLLLSGCPISDEPIQDLTFIGAVGVGHLGPNVCCVCH